MDAGLEGGGSARREVGWFIAVAYAWSWGWWLPIVLEEHGWAHIPWHSKVPGIMGPLIAAVSVTVISRGPRAVQALVQSMLRWRVGSGMLAAALSPLALLVMGALLGATIAGDRWPPLRSLGRMLGWPDCGVAGLLVLSIVVTGFGEETGWRGFALPRLQQLHSPLAATLLLTGLWGFWHTPLFLMHEGLPVTLPLVPVFYLGLFCGAVILTWIYNRTGGSVLMAALFHVSNNLASGTDAAQGFIQAFETSGVVIGAVILVALELRASRKGTRGFLGPPSSCDSTTGSGVGDA